MAETSHDIRRELEVTRERVGDTIAALEWKMNPKRVLDEYPLVVLGVAFGVGVIASRTGAGGKAVQTIRSRVRDMGHAVHDMGHGPARAYGSLQGSVGDVAEQLLQSIVGAATAAGTAKLGEVIDVIAHRYGAPRPMGRPTGTTGTPRSFATRPVDEGYDVTHPAFAGEHR